MVCAATVAAARRGVSARLEAPALHVSTVKPETAVKWGDTPGRRQQQHARQWRTPSANTDNRTSRECGVIGKGKQTCGESDTLTDCAPSPPRSLSVCFTLSLSLTRARHQSHVMSTEERVAAWFIHPRLVRLRTCTTRTGGTSSASTAAAPP